MIDSSKWRSSEAYRTQARNEVDAQRAALMLPRTARTGPQMVSAAMIRISAKQGLDVRGMTASEAANALKEHTRPTRRPYDPMTASPAEVDAYLTSIFGPA
jgi:hypothetical protein